jgi:polar amino acid transport system permease protein
MSNATRHTSEVPQAQAPVTNGRRLKTGGMPCVPTSLLSTSIVTVVAVVLASWYTIAVMRSSLLAAQLDSAAVNALAVVLALLSLAIVVPLVRALRFGNAIRDAAARRRRRAAPARPRGINASSRWVMRWRNWFWSSCCSSS